MMNIKSYVMAARPKTLPAAIVPVFLGCVLTHHLTGVFDAWLAVCTVLGVISIQISTNFFNDAIDADKGADTEKRLGPVRVTASGLLSRRAVYGIAVLFLLVASGFGYVLFDARGWVILAIGVPSLYLCYGYTGGPVPLAYRGLGEVFVVLFFGVIAVMGTMFVQSGEWMWEGAVLGLQVGLLSAALISINNLRDREEDTGNNKRTLAVKLGDKCAKKILVVEIVLPCLLGLIWWLNGDWKLAAGVVPYLILGVYILRGVMANQAGALYNRYLALSGLQLIAFGALFYLATVY